MNKSFCFDAKFDKETGVSTVTIHTPIGHFTGTAKLHPEDIDLASEIRGCTIAHARALSKFYKTQKKNLENQLAALNKIYNNFKSMRGFDPTDRFMSKIRREIKDLEHDIKEADTKITNTKVFLNEYFYGMATLASYLRKRKEISDKTE